MEGAGNVVESRCAERLKLALLTGSTLKRCLAHRSAVQLGSDLTLMMLIEVDPTRSAALHSALAEHQRTLRDVHLITRICEPIAAPNAPHAAHRPSRFHMAAIDRPGLVHIITSAQPLRRSKPPTLAHAHAAPVHFCRVLGQARPGRG